MFRNLLTALRASLWALPLALAACGQAPGPQGPQGPPEVTVARPLVMQVMDWDEYTGRLEAVGSVEVRARVSGYLESVHFDEGTVVEQGDLLFVIDPRPYEAALNEARAGLTSAEVRRDLARNDLARARKLFESRAVSEEELDSRNKELREAMASLEAARAAVQGSELDLEFTRVRAPIRGRIGRELVTVGNLVSGGTAQATLLTTIVSIDPVHVYFTADERAYLRYMRLLGEGDGQPDTAGVEVPVRLQLADEEGFPHEGRLDFVDNRVDEATGTMQGRAVLPNPDGLLTPGLFARVQLLGRGPYEAILVPDSAVGTDQSRRFVYVVDDDGQAARRDVEPGRRIGELRVIRDGLDGTERVVVKGLQRVRPGNPVKASETELERPQEGDGAAWTPPE
ncbi:MAG: efflux RND transporter periplasmic adaptor subunit [Gammaproteobacteria bacterium]